MKYIIIGVLVIVLFAFFLIYLFRRRNAIRKVKCDTDLEKLKAIDAALKPFGFAFDLEQDVVVSREDAWQKEFGYMDLYDAKAPFFAMVMDSMPIYFDYHNKRYRVEFWKGQYGLTTGAEVGVYVQDESCISKKFYRCCRPDECFAISFDVFKKCKLFSRCGISWWLTGFEVGLFSKPKDLAMDICIKFPDCEMRDAFVRAMIQAGYSMANLDICDNYVCFEYCIPPYYKPNCSHRLVKCIAQIFNYINCHIYMVLTRPFRRTLDQLTYIRYMAPCLYRLIIKLCVPQRKKKCYHK